MIPTIFDLCIPRDDVARGAFTDADFAADLAQVVRGTAPKDYRDPALFFSNTYPTRGLKLLLENVCQRLSGKSATASVFRLDTSFGGGKTHGLIALVHAAHGMKGVANVAEFISPSLVPTATVRVAEFDGENSDPMNGRDMGEGIFAKTPWGELAYRLAGRAGYERVRNSDEQMVAPGAETIQSLFGGQPTLILLDEMADWLRRVRHLPAARDQLSPFLKGLFKAVESTPDCAVVFTLALGKEGKTKDAHADDALFVADRMAEAASVAARKATLLNPTEDDETVHVIRRRLFKSVDEVLAAPIIEAYHSIWFANKEKMAPEAIKPETFQAFTDGYPFHPELIHTLTGKTATLADFQRVRGMLRLLGRTVGKLWADKPSGTTAIHLHHIDPGYSPIYAEVATKLGQSMFVPAIRNDISAEMGKTSLAQEIDENNYKGLAPYTQYVARCAFMHTLAYNDELKGVSQDHLRYSIASPLLDLSFIDDARQKFLAESAYLDDRPNAPLRFLVEANLTQVVRKEERNVDPGEARSLLIDKIKEIFSGHALELIPFPSGAYDVSDDVGDGKPKLAVISYDSITVGVSVDEVPELIARIHKTKGSDESGFRFLRNNLVFVVADEAKMEDMREKVRRRLALRELKKPERLAQLAEHQQLKVKEDESKSEAKVAIAIQQCYRHIFYPSKLPLGSSGELAHSAIDIPAASEKPGSGQQQVVRALKELNKLRLGDDEPDAPTYIRDKTRLKKGQMTTADLRNEFREDVGLPMLGDDEIFKKAIRRGVESGEYIYKRGEFFYAKGDPFANIEISQDAIVFTHAYASSHGIYPRPTTPTSPLIPGLGGVSSIPSSIPAGGISEPLPPTGGYSGAPSPGNPSPGSPTATPPTTPPPPVPGVLVFNAEGVLKGALSQLWEQARAKKVANISKILITMYEAGDGFRLLGAIGAVPNATRIVKLAGGYETTGGSEMELEFTGTPEDAKPVKDFLEPQLRAAKDKTIKVSFELEFQTGLPLVGDAAEKFAERLAKFASGAAYVSATAEGKA